VVDEIVSGGLSVRQVAAEEPVFAASRGELYDIVFAVCVGALDGRYPEVGQLVPRRIAMVTKANARFFADGGNPRREPPIPWC
jgi:hypothetical protein